MLPPKKLQSLISNGFKDSIQDSSSSDRKKLLKDLQKRNAERKNIKLLVPAAQIKEISENSVHVKFDDGINGYIEFDENFLLSLPFKISNQQYMKLIHIVDGHITWPCIPDFNTNEIYDEITKDGKVKLPC